MQSEFNLIDEPWIKVRQNTEICEVSVRTALLDAHKYTALAGEMPTQDLAVLRFLLAVLYSALEDTLKEMDTDEIEQWKTLWKGGQFPAEPIEEYFQKWYNRFYLFDDKYPFYQVSEVDKKISEAKVGIAKFNGERSESDNKPRLFPMISGENEVQMSYAEAARWLLSINAFDDSSSKQKWCDVTENQQTRGWCGDLGNIYAVGDNLFETLMLNMSLTLEDNKQFGAQKPVWSLDFLPTNYGEKKPDNPAELLTLLDRYVFLCKKKGAVTGIKLFKKPVVAQATCFTEQMTIWKTDKKDTYIPYKHDGTKQIWREFSAFMPMSDNGKQKIPGIVCWIKGLYYEDTLPKNKLISFATCGVKYDSKGCSIIDTFSDSITVHSSLLSELGEDWNQRIAEEIQKCEEVGGYFWTLQKELIQSQASISEKSKKSTEQICNQAKEQFYSRLDILFREWIESLDTDMNFENEAQKWQQTARKIALKYAEELIQDAGQAAIMGRYEGENKHYSTAEAKIHFQGKLKKIWKGDAE